jgi:hypothetical protein
MKNMIFTALAASLIAILGYTAYTISKIALRAKVDTLRVKLVLEGNN